jgi:hypothetical protein
LGDCRSIVDSGPKTVLVQAGAVAPTLTNGEIRAGRYHRSKVTFYNPGNEPSDDSAVALQVEVVGAIAALHLNQETWLITMGAPPSAAPKSIEVSCSVHQQQNVGIELKDQVSYQADSATLQLLIPTSPTNTWALSQFVLDN